MRIYTGTGDTGETGLYGGQRVSKDDIRVEAYGTIDEANAALGVAASHLDNDTTLREVLEALQRELFTVGADLATPLHRDETNARPLPRVQASHSVALETLIDQYDSTLEPLRNFILPGGTPGASALHLARAVIRRAERCTVTLVHAVPEEVNPEVLRYLNRLADLLFVLARAANNRAGITDIPWTRPSG
jgi:cob(I)alamin adenosyltransferase